MRTTIDLADDIFFAAKDQARRERRSLGTVVSELVRRALTQTTASAGSDSVQNSAADDPLAALGLITLPPRGGVVTNELINQLRDDGPY